MSEFKCMTEMADGQSGPQAFRPKLEQPSPFGFGRTLVNSLLAANEPWYGIHTTLGLTFCKSLHFVLYTGDFNVLFVGHFQ